MPQTSDTNRRLVLAERPKGAPNENTLRLETADIPTPKDGEMLLRTEFLSLDPYMRGRMSAAKSYADPVEIGEVMVGGTIAEVITSNHPKFEKGEFVVSFSGWQDYAVSDGAMVNSLGKTPQNPSWALGVLGMPGFTAWAGLTQIGMPKAGETVVVGGATGPVGATVGQIAKILGCRVVGIAGGAEKCAYAVDELGFDACVDYKTDTLNDDLAAATPDGIDIYFENVGGKVFDAVMPLLNTGARIPLCGLISQYNATSLPDGPDRMGMLMGQLLTRRITMRGFIIFDDFGHLYPEFAAQMIKWVTEGKIKYREEIIEGLENAPEAFIGLLNGEAFGKRVIRVGNAD
ncbi:NADP-dependent oxidoreductase [Amylibacter kogurei]|uniref:NADP-dependent oxidoreductase n=1 Tax=Paramylibacter kogurei TaxID=1889778 RepID=A0A2G5K5X0_9RHOB|nr:NADP-dependent oxidoreductase [Amylibacter kogurei]PIB24937.1 NADP-dependent oxidoreductase [Amylibacter kogurei]